MRQTNTSSSSIANPRPDIITGEFKAALRRAGVVEAYLFGSILRGDERPDSDIDILVRFEHEFSLIEQLDLMLELSRLAGRDVDLLTEIHPVFEPYIAPTLVPIQL